MIKTAIVGGSGYVGGELLRLLLFHPKVKVVGVTSKSHIGKKISMIHQNLNKICHLSFQKENISKLTKELDVLFIALPHGLSMKIIAKVNLNKTKVIDLGADFRLKDSLLFEKVYGFKHQAGKLLDQAVYGLPEVYKEQIKKAKLIACPGCFPTGAILALFPLAKKGLLDGNIVIDSKTGSSGSGIKPSEATHHPERAQDFKAYNVFTHRHSWEMSQALDSVQGKKTNLVFTAHSLPLVRGIFTTAYVFLKKKASEQKVKKLYEEVYVSMPFIRLVDNPRLVVIAGTNYCDMKVYVKDNKVIVTSVIDNLVKGAAGQAVQNMNLMFGLPETMGLEFPGTHP